MKNVRIGLYSAGLRAYWSQFKGLKERLIGYNRFIEEKLSAYGTVCNFGLLDDVDAVDEAIRYFSAARVDIIFLHSATYFTSDSVLPLHLSVKVPVVVLNLQPSPRIDYEHTDTGEWLAQCCACPVPEISNAFERAGIPFRFVSGLLGLSRTPEIAMSSEETSEHPAAVRAWTEIEEWVRAAGIKAELSRSVFGFLGGNYSGMLDMYSDFTMLSAQAGIRVKILEMCDLNAFLSAVTEEEIAAKREEICDMFEIAEDSPSDPRVRKPTDEQLDWSAKVAVAQEKMVAANGLGGLAYYYHSVDGNPYEELQSGFIVGHSLLTAKGVPCAGEADLKTALAMKIGDLAEVGGSFAEIVVADYRDGTILIGHDGPFHIRISDRKPILRGMQVYHGKKGSGISVEAKVCPGPITTLNVTQTRDGKMKFIISEAEATDGPIMTIGNTQTPVRFSLDPDSYMEKWFAEAPTHHCALTVGHNAGLFRKVGDLLDVPTVVL
ncbi:MAG: L-fucose/L-arabinose isomerase family protein [Ruminococcus sp.]|nr:L-fucose/L-arabinose isomerase family protein [Candidatus Apopatosoma intestinale]